MSYLPFLEESALHQMGGLPGDALDVLVERVARICLDPYDRMLSMPLSGGRPGARMAELGHDGFVEFAVDEANGLVRVYLLVWLG